MNKLIVAGVLLLLAVGISVVITHQPQPLSNSSEQSKLYQGPVPYGYNQTHFYQTGETIKNGAGVTDGRN